MATNARSTQDCIGSVDERSQRALEQYLTVLPDQGVVRDKPGQVLVTSESGSEYLVDVRLGTCECDDQHYRQPDGGCKHVRRARFATGVKAIPAAAASQLDVDPSLGEHTDADLQFATADGGVVQAGEQATLVEGDADDCACTELPDDVPCADCFIHDGVGFGEGGR